MNRGAFYAYGSYLNLINKNAMKRIMRTELVNVDKLARSYGFGIAPKVNTGKFLKENITISSMHLFDSIDFSN